MTTALLDSEIVYNRPNRDYDILICGQLVASASTYSQAEAIRTRLLAERRDEGLYAAATELDPPGPGGPEPDDLPVGNDPSPGRAIYRHFGQRPRHFIDTLRRLDPSIWHVLAEAYVAYRGGTVEQTLLCWHLAVTETQHIPSDYRADFVAHPIVVAADASAESYAGMQGGDGARRPV